MVINNITVLIDFKRNKLDIPAVVERLEYDPNRSANIALVLYKDGERRYILAPKGLSVGDQIQSGVNSPIKVGNSLPMRNIPVGSTVHNVELKPGKGGQIARSAGAYVQIIAREGNYVTLRLRSGEMRKVLADVLLQSVKLVTQNICFAYWVKLVLTAGEAFALQFVVLQ